ncbi:hypothetical protein FOMPIDRAFT_1045454 [Fomitopsis schrenkii]|uniref:DUF6533 domain-containing protein n=1 Tax=Fomitopsis schrenkii TaxID=2126942 RepID=S8EP25_FOMSC|nr:hypothetical protein FOMPIDRAFT_1045454 [Fomitopsis schrenkii]
MSMGDAALQAQLISVLEINQIAICCEMAVSVALLYDHLLTLSSEIELFWHRPTRALSGTAIFMLNRLVSVGLAIMVHVDSDLPHYTYASCKYPGIVLVSLQMLAYALWAVVSAIRVHALTRGFWPLSLLTLALALVPLVADMWLLSTITWSIVNIGFLAACGESSPISVRLNTICVMASDLIVLIVTLYYVSPRPWVRAVSPSGSLSRVLLRNGTVYFCVLAIVNLLEIILYVTSTTNFVNLFVAPISTIVISRFLLDIRAAAYRTDSTTEPTLNDLTVGGPFSSPSQGMWHSILFDMNTDDYSDGALSLSTDDLSLCADTEEVEMKTLKTISRPARAHVS